MMTFWLLFHDGSLFHLCDKAWKRRVPWIDGREKSVPLHSHYSQRLSEGFFSACLTTLYTISLEEMKSNYISSFSLIKVTRRYRFGQSLYSIYTMTRWCHRRKPPFGPHFIKFPKTVTYEVNVAAQSSQSEVLLLSKFWSKRGGF